MRYIVLVMMILMTVVFTVWAHDDEDEADHRDTVDTSEAVVPENPTYYEHVKPILEQHCIACHSEGQISGDTPLTDPEVVVKASSDIAFNASIAYMPPWMPSPLSLPMQHNRSLSDTEIATLIAWSDQGAPLGDPDDYVPFQPTFDLPEVRADMTLQTDEPYTPDEAVLDDYRCFAFPLNFDQARYLVGYEFMPDISEMAHHGILYLVGSSAKPDIERRNYEDGRIGWSCYGGTGLSANSEIIGTWAPGANPLLYTEGTGFRLDPGDTLILQMHYNLTITNQSDQTAVNLQFADESTDITELQSYALTAPVEIPCPGGMEDQPQCQRQTAIERLAELYGQGSSRFPDSLLQGCQQTLSDYANNTGEYAIGYCDHQIPASLTMYNVLGHMHERGLSFQLELNPDSDQAVMILDIPNWDFDWQDSYQFQEPLKLQRGDILRVTCQWDNTLSDDPRYVVWGEGTAEEMCVAIGAVSSN